MCEPSSAPSRLRAIRLKSAGVIPAAFRRTAIPTPPATFRPVFELVEDNINSVYETSLQSCTALIFKKGVRHVTHTENTVRPRPGLRRCWRRRFDGTGRNNSQRPGICGFEVRAGGLLQVGYGSRQSMRCAEQIQVEGDQTNHGGENSGRYRSACALPRDGFAR